MPQGKSISELRSEYYSLRKNFNRRINRLAKGTTTQKSYAQPFQKGGKMYRQSLSELGEVAQSEKLLKKEIADLKMFMDKARLSITGWRKIEKETIASLRASGYNITKKNLAQFGEYMERMRQLYGNKIFPSEQVAEEYDLASEGTPLSDQALNELISSQSGGISGIDLFL